jgi:predicted TIM-barrel fold metal-dependent hydrolase
VPGSDPELLRRQLLDEYDVSYAILDPLGMANCYDAPELMAELCRAQNDWLAEEWLSFDSRLLGSIAVPHEYPELAVREIEQRAADRRFAQVIFPGAAQSPLGSPRYWKIYEAAAAHDLPVAYHPGGFHRPVSRGWHSYYLEEHAAISTGEIAELVLSLVCQGVFDAIPNLKVVMVEGGVSWITALRWALDEAWTLLRDEEPRLQRKPSEYVHDHIWFTTQPIEEPDDPRDLWQMIKHARLADRLLFSTDYPHWDFDSPTRALPRGIPATGRADIFANNACELFGLPREGAVRAS